MAIITDIKDSIRKAIYSLDKSINFSFEKIQRAEFPYVFFYIPSYKPEKTIDTQFTKITLLCAVEYEKERNSKPKDLWAYVDTLEKAFGCFDFLNIKTRALQPEYKLVEDVLQMTFNLELYVKEEDITELMRELDLTIGGTY